VIEIWVVEAQKNAPLQSPKLNLDIRELTIWTLQTSVIRK